MTNDVTPVISLPDEAKAVIWRIVGPDASPLQKVTAFGLIEPVIRKYAPSADLERVTKAIREWFHSYEHGPRLKAQMVEPVAVLILEGMRAERENTAIWAVGSIDDVGLATHLMRGSWSPAEIDSFVEAVLVTLGELCKRDEVIDATRCTGFGPQGSMEASIPKSTLERPGKLQTFSHLDSHGFEFVYHGLHPAAGNLIELAMELRPEYFSSLIDRLDHPVMQARAAYRVMGAARRVDHRSTLQWIGNDSSDSLIALAVFHTLHTINRLDDELRYASSLDENQHSWSTELNPLHDNVDIAATDLLTGMIDRLARLHPLRCARWMGELLNPAPYMFPVHDEREIGPRNEQLEKACTEVLVRLVHHSWSDELFQTLCSWLSLRPRITWRRHLAEIAWELRKADPERATELARLTVDGHDRYIKEQLKQNVRLYLRWNEWDHRKWLRGLGLALALSCEELEPLHWVSTRCQTLPLSVWDAEERLEEFGNAHAAAQHWFLVALHAIWGRKELGCTIDCAAVRALAEKIWAHCHFGQQYLSNRSEASVTVETLAGHYAAKFGSPSDEWILEQACDSRVGPCALWALIDQSRSEGNLDNREIGKPDKMTTKELVRIASDRFDGGGQFGLEELRFWGLLWFALGAISEAEQTAFAIVAFPLTEHDRGLKILALKLFALVASKGRMSPAVADCTTTLYEQLWSVYTSTEELGDREQIDELLEGSGIRPKAM